MRDDQEDVRLMPRLSTTKSTAPVTSASGGIRAPLVSEHDNLIDALIEALVDDPDDLPMGVYKPAIVARRALVSHIEGIRAPLKWLSAHGCLTGDCPHNAQTQCDKALADAYRELAKGYE